MHLPYCYSMAYVCVIFEGVKRAALRVEGEMADKIGRRESNIISDIICCCALQHFTMLLYLHNMLYRITHYYVLLYCTICYILYNTKLSFFFNLASNLKDYSE